MKWKRESKPDPFLCPENYCFHWSEQGTSFSPGMHETVVSAVIKADLVVYSKCNCTFGSCLRLQDKEIRSEISKDYFEPHEIALERGKLPWFYFISHPLHVNPEIRASYIYESEALWGKDHWKDERITRPLPCIGCDFNAAGWSEEPDDDCYYILSQSDRAKIHMYEGMTIFVYMYENREMTEIVGCEATLERYNDIWRAKPNKDTFYSGPICW
jgi:hypothetical protein